MAIPKIIYQTCKDKNKLNQDYLENIEKIKRLNKGWSYRLYDDRDVHVFFRKNFSQSWVELLKKINPEYGVVFADIFRYAAIYMTGGVYLDIKSTMNAPLDSVLSEEDTYVVSQWDNRMGGKYAGYGVFPELQRIPGGEFQQWHIIATQKHPLLRYVLASVFHNIEIYSPYWFGVGKIGVLRLTGPICYSLTLAPALGRFSHRFVTTQEIGFEYSFYPRVNGVDQHTLEKNHYSNLKSPIVIH